MRVPRGSIFPSLQQTDLHPTKIPSLTIFSVLAQCSVLLGTVQLRTLPGNRFKLKKITNIFSWFRLCYLCKLRIKINGLEFETRDFQGAEQKSTTTPIFNLYCEKFFFGPDSFGFRILLSLNSFNKTMYKNKYPENNFCK